LICESVVSAQRLNLFIVDNEALVRFALTQLLQKEASIKVVGSSAVTPSLVSDVRDSGAEMILVDIPVPREKGIEVLKKLGKLRLPIIVFTKSDDTIANDLIPLLEAGAVGFVLKPTKEQTVADVLDQLMHEIQLNTKKSKKKNDDAKPKAKPVSFLDPLKIIVVGSSTGGPEALETLVSGIPANTNYGYIFVQHMPAGFTTRFADRINKRAAISISEAQSGDVLKPGTGLLAPGGTHLVFKEIQKGNRRLIKALLTEDPPVWGLRPTVDKMMSSVAPIYKQNCLGIILTGMGEDGVIGTREIKNNGGYTIVQDKKSSVVYGMAQQVVKNNLADEVLPLPKIMPRALQVLVRKPN
jgi:two-component system chemotaxis response regulator CheB